MERKELIEKIDRAVEELSDELVDFAIRLFSIPTQNPPGNNYPEFAKEFASEMEKIGMEVEFCEVPEDRLAELVPHCAKLVPDVEPFIKPRINIIGYMGDKNARPNIHFTGHYDVVPEGTGWSTDPYGCEIRDGNIYARGSGDQKAGLVSEVMAAYALKKAGIKLNGTMICSASADEESGGQAGVGYMVEQGYLTKESTDYCVITECLDYDKVCIGHRGTLWMDVNVKGIQCHGSQPGEGLSPIIWIQKLLNYIDQDIRPLITEPTPLPVMPPTSRWTTFTPTMIESGQKVNSVAETGKISFDIRLIPEHSIEWAKNLMISCCEKVKADMPGSDYSIEYYEEDNPTLVPRDQKLVDVFMDGVRDITGNEPMITVSPGMDDQKYVVQRGKLENCILYGPGRLTLAHKSDEYQNIEEMKASAKIMALGACDMLGIVE
ncbi:MAG: ArgE/DapE family deacylase [Eubacterium sp.]|nr:ArgE/DapE family deacylase [Eubacterium sp.]